MATDAPSGERTVFFDLETAGLKTDSSIIQIGAVAVDTAHRELETFEAKIRFHLHGASAKALRLNAFEPTVWKRLARPPHEAAREFARFLRRHATVDLVSQRGTPYRVAQLAAHNAAFDGPHLRRWYRRLGMFLPASPRVLCTLQRAMWMFQEDTALTPPDNYKLATLCEYFAVPLPDCQAHDALADVRATAALYRRMLAEQPSSDQLRRCG